VPAGQNAFIETEKRETVMVGGSEPSGEGRRSVTGKKKNGGKRKNKKYEDEKV